MPEFYRNPAIIVRMRRYLLLLMIIFLACQTVTPSRPAPSQTELPTSGMPTSSQTASLPSLPVTPTASVTASPTLTLLPATATFTPLPATTSPVTKATLTQATTPSPAPLQVAVRMHPDGGLYVGDQVSFEVFVAPQDEDGSPLNQVVVQGPDGSTLGTAGFGQFGLGQQEEAILTWAWDTRGLQAGEYPITFTLEPTGQVWTETVSLLPQAGLPYPEPQAHWASAHSQCCTIYYITGTAAARDISDLLRQADEQSRDAVQRMGIDFTAPITITLLSRVLGHGGFAGQEIDISYLDRNYAGSNFDLVLHHEMIHILDGRLGGEYRPSLFVEGLAVYETGGHFKPEPLMPRAAALLATETGLGWYIPLAELADNFYLSQHEIGYLEGAALIEYMLNTWGWEAFSSFYRDIHPPQDDRQSSAIDAALQNHFQISFAELEAQFKDALRRIPVTEDLRQDTRLTVQYFDTVRRYQQLFDPSAFFQTAWLVDAVSMRQRGIVADYLRHPAAPDNLAIETILENAFNALTQGKYTVVQQAITAINAVLDAVQRGNPQPFEVNGQAADFYAIVQAVSRAGYEVQKVMVGGDTAQVWATAGSTVLVELILQNQGTGWELSAPTGFKNGDLRWAAPPQIPIWIQWSFGRP
jgi:hypothetical protein